MLTTKLWEQLRAEGLAELPASISNEGIVTWHADDVGAEQRSAFETIVEAFFDPSTRAREELTAYAADLRWRREVEGIEFGGVPVATDDRSKIMIMGARVAAAADPEWSTVWHGADGATYPIDAATMIAISDAVQEHVNAGFATFASVKADIESGTIIATAEVDAAFG